MAQKADGQEVRLRNRVRGFLDQAQDATGKKALKACAELAAEFPHAHLAKAALSIAYIKLGMIQQSVAIVEEAVKKSAEWILDQGSIYYYTAAMKSLERTDLVEQVWEKAAAADKKSVAHLEKLFSACLRSGNTTRQISCAMELWKLTNDDKYLMWSIVARAQPELKPDLPRSASIAGTCAPLSSSSSSEASSSTAVSIAQPNRVLQLSHMLWDTKFVKTGKVTKHLDLDFMLRVLIQQGQADQALELIRSDLSQRLYGIKFQKLSEEAAILLYFSRTEEARSLYETLLSEHNTDEWSWYLGYFNALFGSVRPVASPDETKVKGARSLLKSLQDKCSSGVKLRAPYLAEMELEKMLGTSPDSILPLLVQFFNDFGSKPSTYRDMMPYVACLSHEAQGKLLEQVKDKVNLDPTTLTAETPLSVFGVITTYKSLVRTLRHDKMDETERSAEIEALWGIYNAARKADHPREATERFCADDLLSMIAHYHCDRFLSEVQSTSTVSKGGNGHTFDGQHLDKSPLRHLVAAAVVLEHGVAHSVWNFQFRLLLNEIYVAMGAVRSTMDQFDGVEVKHIQLDSVGYMFVDAWVRYAAINDLNKVVKKATIFYDDSRRSTADFAFEAYQKQAYHKVKEVTNFADRLNNSAHRHALRLDHLLLSVAESSSLPVALSLITSFDPLGKLPSSLADIESYHKNHDREALDWWATSEPSLGKHIEIPSGNLRSTCYPDSLQNARILSNSLFIQILALLAQYQPPAPNEKPGPAPPSPLDTRLSPLANQLATAVTAFSQDHHEHLIWRFVTNTLNLVLAMFALSPSLSSDKPDSTNVNAFRGAVDAIQADFELLNAKLMTANGSRIICTNNAPLLTSFLVRSLVALPLCVPLLPKLLPGKPRPKTPEDVKSQTAILKTALRDIGDICRKQLSLLEQMLQQEAVDTNNFALESEILAASLPECLNQKTLSKVVDGLVYSRRDTHQTLLALVQHKIRDFKTL